MTELTLDNEMRRKYLRLHLSIMTADRLGTLLRLTGGQGDHESPGPKIFHLLLSSKIFRLDLATVVLFTLITWLDTIRESQTYLRKVNILSSQIANPRGEELQKQC